MADPAAEPPILQDIWRALEQIEDPCMCLAGRGLSIVDMGIVTRVEFEGGLATVKLLFTDPSCLFELRITQAIETRVAAIPGVRSVTIDISCDSVWTPDRLSARATSSFAKDRSRLLKMTPSATPERRDEKAEHGEALDVP